MKETEWTRGCASYRNLGSTGRIPASARDHHTTNLHWCPAGVPLITVHLHPSTAETKSVFAW